MPLKYRAQPVVLSPLAPTSHWNTPSRRQHLHVGDVTDISDERHLRQPHPAWAGVGRSTPMSRRRLLNE